MTMTVNSNPGRAPKTAAGTAGSMGFFATLGIFLARIVEANNPDLAPLGVGEVIVGAATGLGAILGNAWRNADPASFFARLLP